VDFEVVGQKFFSRGPTVKFNFTNTETERKLFFYKNVNTKISNFKKQVGLAPPSDAHACGWKYFRGDLRCNMGSLLWLGLYSFRKNKNLELFKRKQTWVSFTTSDVSH